MVSPMKENIAFLRSTAADPAFEAIDELPLPYIEIDASGIVTRANRFTNALHPDDQGELIGKMVWESMPLDEQEQNCAAYFSLMESGEDPPMARRSIYDRSGHFRIYELHRSLMRNEEGRPTGMRMVCVDVTEATKEMEEEHRVRLWLESVIASLTDGVIVTDALGFIRAVNPAAETLLGWKAAELTGKLIEKLLPVLSFVSSDETRLSFTMTLAGSCRGIATILDQQRRQLRVEIGTSPILNQENGFTEGVVTVLRRLNEAA